MENEYLKTLELLKKEKQKIIDKINNDNIDESEKINLYNSIIFLDGNINTYNNQIKKGKYIYCYIKIIILN